MALTGIVTTYIVSSYKKHPYITKLIYASLILNLLCTYIFFQIILFKRNTPPLDLHYDLLLKHIETPSPNWYITDFLSGSPIDQTKILQKQQFLLSSNYGLQLKNSPTVSFTKYDFSSNNEYPYHDILPRYILTNKNNKKIHGFPAKLVETNGDAALYEIKKYTPFVSIQTTKVNTYSKISSVDINTNKITVKAKGHKDETLRVLQSNYPGWRIYMDNSHSYSSPLSDRFLATKMIEGTHLYTFYFYSDVFSYGAFISIISLLLWICFIIYKNFSFFKNHGNSKHNR